MKRKKHRPPIAGRKGFHAKVKKGLLKTADQIWATRRRHGGDSNKWAVFSDALEIGFQFIDRKTGEVKPLPAVASVISPLLFHEGLKFFHQTMDINQFANDAALIEAMDDSSLMLWAARPDNSCLHANRTLRECTGRSIEQFRDMAWANVLHPDDHDNILGICMSRFKTRQPFPMIYRIVRKDGEYIWIFDYVHPRYRPDGRFAGYIGTMIESPGPCPTLKAGPNIDALLKMRLPRTEDAMAELLSNFDGTPIMIFEAKNGGRH